MPYIQVSLYTGRTDQQKQDFAKSITKSAVEILKTKEEHVIVVFDENPKENWFLAGNQL
jgi:4-oxalocrotonate tautomerase